MHELACIDAEYCDDVVGLLEPVDYFWFELHHKIFIVAIFAAKQPQNDRTGLKNMDLRHSNACHGHEYVQQLNLGLCGL